MIRARSDTAWHEAKLNQSLEKGDWLRTGKACRAEVILEDGSVIRVGEETEYQLTDLTGEQGDFKLAKGKIWANLKKLGQKRDRLNFHTPAAVAAIRALPPMEGDEEDGVVYEVVVNDDQSTDITVYQGQVNVGSVSSSRQVSGQVDLATWTRIVDEMWLRERGWMRLKADGSTEEGTRSVKAEAEDDWIKWNRERDQARR